ncbi:anti-sigma factor [Paenibacillus hamazuiensis]|uniref:anti-sigma factor n=1 Tax=Paenibacillus hamazuiensis TaxID=2936508 RepID=UPI00200E2AD6|nr:anti-sigma factor [Paenibacillus hamazuiensis]
MKSEIRPCDQLVLYMAGEMTEEERTDFADHLSSCADCREEYEELQQVWQVLPYEMEEMEPPAEWKEELLGGIIGAESQENIRTAGFTVTKEPAWRRFSRYAAATAAGLLVLGAASWWGLTQMQKQGDPPTALKQQEKAPSQMLKQYTLKSFDNSAPAAKGQAWLTKKGSSMELVLQTSGLPVLEGEQAYQVWGVKDGKRQNCGTFKVDPGGNGVHTYMITETEHDFDTIGITLEPDSNGNQPRGKKMLGS